jgi:hypothetical protein
MLSRTCVLRLGRSEGSADYFFDGTYDRVVLSGDLRSDGVGGGREGGRETVLTLEGALESDLRGGLV